MNPNLVKGKIVLCENNPDIGGSYDTVLAAGGAGVIIAGGGESGDTNLLDSGRAALEKGTNTIPLLRVTSRGRETLMEYLRSTRRPLAKILPTRTVLGVAPAPVVADFSSRGPLRYAAGHAQWLKPDIAAPGVEILAAGVGNNEFAFMSGTSMACPHVSGVAALLKSVHPSWSPAAIRSALMTTATMLNNLNETITAQETGSAASPLDFGAGFIRPEQAMRPGLVYDMGVHDYLTFMCALGYPNNETRQIDRDAPPCPTGGGHLPPRVEDANFPSFFAVFGDVSLNSSAVTFRRILTNVETGCTTATYIADVVSPQGYSVIVEPTTLIFTKFMEKCEFTLTVVPVYNHVADRQFATLRWSDGKHVVQSPIVIDSNVVA